MLATTLPTLRNQTIEEMGLDENGIETFTYDQYDVWDIEIQEPDHLESGIYDTQATGVITWQGEHHVVEKLFRGTRTVTITTVRNDARPWVWTGEVIGYEPEAA